MPEHSFFFGDPSNAPQQALAGLGTLIAPQSDVVVLYVPTGAGGAYMEPIRLQDARHVYIHIEDRAVADVTIWLEGVAASHTAEVILGKEARCTLTTVNAVLPDATIAIKQHSSIQSAAHMHWRNVALGGKTVEHDLVSHVQGADGESNIDWVCYAKGTEKQALTVKNIFDAQNGRGEILMRGIAEEKGHILCKGLIDIGLKGTGTNTYLTQEVLMLDATSKVDAIPSLEIKTNDVKASHSATVARVTEEDLFYFGARGIAPHEARHMFVLGFLGDIMEGITEEVVRKEVIAAIERKYER